MDKNSKISKPFSDAITAEQVNWQVERLSNDVKGADITEDRQHIINSRLIGIVRNIQQDPSSNTLNMAQIALDSITDQLQAEIDAIYDHLTGLLNRAGIEKFSKAHFSEAKRHDKDIGVFFIDLNKFKPINDGLGHAEGDKALKFCAKEIRENIRREDLIARVGGDEFVIIALDERGSDWTTLYNKLTEVFDNLVYQTDDDIDCPIGGSIGFVIAKDEESPESAIARADVEMYKVKNGSPNPNEDLHRGLTPNNPYLDPS